MAAIDLDEAATAALRDEVRAWLAAHWRGPDSVATPGGAARLAGTGGGGTLGGAPLAGRLVRP